MYIYIYTYNVCVYVKHVNTHIYIIKMIYSPAAPPASTKKLRQRKNPATELEPKH